MQGHRRGEDAWGGGVIGLKSMDSAAGNCIPGKMNIDGEGGEVPTGLPNYAAFVSLTQVLIRVPLY